MKNLSKNVRDMVDKRPAGQVFSFEDILQGKSTRKKYLSIAKELSELQRLQRITRIRKGLYFKPRKIEFTKDLWAMKASGADIASYYRRKLNGKMYVTGAPLFNGMGLTEQVAVSEVLAVENPPKSFEKERVFFVKSKCAISDDNVKFLQILDCIENMENVSAKEPGEVIDSLTNLAILQLKDNEYSELMDYSTYYMPRTRAVLAAILATIGKKQLAMEQKKTYTQNSRFEIYFENSKILENKEDYGIYKVH